MKRDLRHDPAWVGALHILSIFKPLLREEEKSDAFLEVYRVMKATLESHDRISSRAWRKRLEPGSN